MKTISTPANQFGAPTGTTKRGAPVTRLATHAWSLDQLRGVTTDGMLESVAASLDPTDGQALRYLWRRYDNLNLATRKLADYLTAFWPGAGEDAGRSAFHGAVAQAVDRVLRASESGEAYEGRIVGLYLYGLASAASALAQWRLYGAPEKGTPVMWNYFEAPIQTWATERRLTRLYLRPAPSDGFSSRETTVQGIRTHLIAAIATTKDAGLMAVHAPNG